jgi:hypothetical protein
MGAHPALIGLPEVQDSIFEALERGMSFNDACHQAGVPYVTGRTWLRKGGGTGTVPPEEAKEPFKSFATQVNEIRARINGELAAGIRNAAKMDWKAGAWLLSRRNPAEYGEDKERAALTVGLDPGTADGQRQPAVTFYVPSNGREAVEGDGTIEPDGEVFEAEGRVLEGTG